MSNRIKEEFIRKREPVRLNKYLSEAGVCSRREADRLIESGKVTVDGRPAVTGMRIIPGQIVKVGRKTVSKQDDMIVLAVNKPKGIVCTEEKRERNRQKTMQFHKSPISERNTLTRTAKYIKMIVYLVRIYPHNSCSE